MSIFKKRDKLVEGAKQLAPEELEKIKSEDAQEQCEELLNPVQEPVPDSQKKEKAPFMHDPFLLSFCALAGGCGCLAVWLLQSNVLLAVQAAVFFGVLMYTAVVDIRTHLVSNWVHLIILAAALLGAWANPAVSNLLNMAFGAVIASIPLFLAAVFTKKHHGVGGGDIRLMFVSGLLLGASKGYTALMIGLLLAVLANGILILLKKADKKAAFALVPYLAIGCMVAYFA